MPPTLKWAWCTLVWQRLWLFHRLPVTPSDRHGSGGIRRHWSNWTPSADTIKQRGVLLPLHRIQDGSKEKKTIATILRSRWCESFLYIYVYSRLSGHGKGWQLPYRRYWRDHFLFCQQVKRGIAENKHSPCRCIRCLFRFTRGELDGV